MLETIILLIAITYLVTLVLGFLMEKYFRIPWVFMALFFGLVLSATGYFSETVASEPFRLLSTLGMLILLFMIGFNVDLKKMKKLKKYIMLGSFSIIFCEAVLMSLMLFIFFPATVDNSYLIAFLVALSFATVGEAILLPILKEFDIIKTKFGQLTLGIGTADDIIEMLVIASIGVLLSYVNVNNSAIAPPEIIVGGLAVIALVSYLLIKFRNGIEKHIIFIFKDHGLSYLVVLAVFFSFVGFAGAIYSGFAPIAAICAGLVCRELFPKKVVKDYKHVVEFVTYIFLAPIFFLGVGAEASLSTIVVTPMLVLAILITAKTAKLGSSYLLFRKVLGTKYSLLMGLGLSVRFSSSLIVQYILYTNGLISLSLYSALIATAIIMKPIIIGAYSIFLSKSKPP